MQWQAQGHYSVGHGPAALCHGDAQAGHTGWVDIYIGVKGMVYTEAGKGYGQRKERLSTVEEVLYLPRHS